MIRTFGFMVMAFIMTVFIVGCNQKELAGGNLPDTQTIEKEDTDEILETKKAEYRKISPQEAKEMLDNDAGIIFVDARDEEEYQEWRIPGTILIPKDDVKDKAAEMLPNKDAVILVHCLGGSRSKPSCEILIEMGYTNVYDVEGGIKGWPYEIVKDEE
ncbi:MAG: rhodanese-like domain-containing protein [Chitinispirillales bacterium]|jgi:rhodanese-related sulfurtransferase|nr:rhodanese-like domain-containing protein [Chitinispirillales bacterium]